MKRISFLLAVVLLSPLTLTNSTCDEDCGFALCDLVTEIVIDGTLSVLAGTPVAIPNLIENLPEVAVACKDDLVETLSAAASQSRIKIDFDANSNATFAQNVKDSQFSVNEISAGSSVTENYTYTFNQPGVYRLITFCDADNANEERNESNNKSADEYGESFRLKGQVKKPLIIHVLPNPDYQRKEGEPYINLISRVVTAN